MSSSASAPSIQQRSLATLLSAMASEFEYDFLKMFNLGKKTIPILIISIVQEFRDLKGQVNCQMINVFV